MLSSLRSNSLALSDGHVIKLPPALDEGAPPRPNLLEVASFE